MNKFPNQMIRSNGDYSGQFNWVWLNQLEDLKTQAEERDKKKKKVVAKKIGMGPREKGGEVVKFVDKSFSSCLWSFILVTLPYPLIIINQFLVDIYTHINIYLYIDIYLSIDIYTCMMKLQKLCEKQN